MISVETGAQVTQVNVMTSDNGGLSSEQITELALDKIVRVSQDAPPAIRDQAEAFKEEIRSVIHHYVELTRKEERGTICQMLSTAGHQDTADLVRRL